MIIHIVASNTLSTTAATSNFFVVFLHGIDPPFWSWGRHVLFFVIPIVIIVDSDRLLLPLLDSLLINLLL